MTRVSYLYADPPNALEMSRGASSESQLVSSDDSVFERLRMFALDEIGVGDHIRLHEGSVLWLVAGRDFRSDHALRDLQ